MNTTKDLVRERGRIRLCLFRPAFSWFLFDKGLFYGILPVPFDLERVWLWTFLGGLFFGGFRHGMVRPDRLTAFLLPL